MLVIGVPKSEQVSWVLLPTGIVGRIRKFGVVFTGYVNKITKTDHIGTQI